MSNISIPKQVIFENMIVINKKINKPNYNKNMNEYEICREYEIKNIYLDNNGNDITNEKEKWDNHLVNKSVIKFLWDNKTNIFAFDFSFLNKDCVNEINFKFNNEKTFGVKLNFKPVNNMFNQVVTSLDFSNGVYNNKNVNSIQIEIKSNDLSKIINIFIGDYFNKKNDFMILKNNSLSLNFQNSIIIKGEEIKNTFSTLKFSPCKIKQGFWNKDIIKLEESSDQIFHRNYVISSKIDNLPISSTTKNSFETKIDTTSNTKLIRIYKNTYYDLKRKETIQGFGENSQPGYIPPFEFSGLFFPVLHLRINGQDISISWEQKFDKPYFKKNEGLNKIYLDHSYNFDKDLEWIGISSELIVESKDHNFTFDEFKEWLKNKSVSK